MVELLSPAGSRESLVAAVQNGADAVYMGFGSFNARRNAKNFSREEFREAVAYCHLRGVRVYLTLNTLLTDREMSAAAEDARFASSIGVDAVLIQDWGVLSLVREVAPDLPIHASTQMSLHTLGGANYAAALGMTRIVLARELSAPEIWEICQKCPAEIEVFVHGALCMCYSGQCALSACIGGRSGNRGTCAQPCRLAYGINGSPLTHPLSLKDANLSHHLGELSEMGVACLKLEGRMKRPEYVAVITAIYARLLREKRIPTEEESRQLAQAFSRSGFTDWYYQGKKGSGMFGTRPENTPEPKELFSEAKRAYEKEDLRRVSLRFTCRIVNGQKTSLTAADEDGHMVSVTGSIPEAARSRALTAEEVAGRLEKTGGTAFTVSHTEVTVDEGLSLSAAALNALRRDALDGLTEARTAPPPRRHFQETPFQKEAFGPRTAPRFTCSLSRPEQLTPELVSCAPTMIYLPLEWLSEVDLMPYVGKTHFCAVLPRIFRTKDEALFRRQLQETRGLSAVAVGNLGHLPIVNDLGLEVRGDFGLNVFNSRSLFFLKEQGLSSATVSFELRNEQIRDLNKILPCEAIVYGRLPLMLMENCVIHNGVGCHCREENDLTDRTGARFPLLPAYGCRNELENSKVLFLADRPDYQKLGLTHARLRFTTESPEDCVRIFQRYLGSGDYIPLDFTRGLYYRGVD